MFLDTLGAHILVLTQSPGHRPVHVEQVNIKRKSAVKEAFSCSFDSVD